MAAGQTLRIAALLPVTTDTTTIDAYMQALGRTRCTCYDTAGAETTCPTP